MQAWRVAGHRDGAPLLPTARRGRSQGSAEAPIRAENVGPTDTTNGHRASFTADFAVRKTPPEAEASSGATLSSNRDGRIELRWPSAILAPLAGQQWDLRGRCCRSGRTGGGSLRSPLAGSHRQGIKKEGPRRLPRAFYNRDGRIRTGDPLNPIQVRYRTAPRPVLLVLLYSAWETGPVGP